MKKKTLKQMCSVFCMFVMLFTAYIPAVAIDSTEMDTHKHEDTNNLAAISPLCIFGHNYVATNTSTPIYKTSSFGGVGGLGCYSSWYEVTVTSSCTRCNDTKYETVQNNFTTHPHNWVLIPMTTNSYKCSRCGATS